MTYDKPHMPLDHTHSPALPASYVDLSMDPSINNPPDGNVPLHIMYVIPWPSIGNLGAQQAKQKSIKQLVHWTCSHPSFFMYISKHSGQQLTRSSWSAILISSIR